MQFVEMLTRTDRHYESTIRLWMFMSTDDYDHMKTKVDVLDMNSVQCDSNFAACLGTPDSFMHSIRDFYGAMQGYDKNGKVMWSREGHIRDGKWHGLVRYATEADDTYLGFYDEKGLNGKMIQ